MSKVKINFIKILAIISILGFIGIALDSFKIIDLRNEIVGLTFVLVGIGLFIEGNIRSFFKMFRNGLTKSEVSHIMAIVMGFFGILAGMLTIFNVQNETFEIIKAILSIAIIIIIAVETWLVK